MRNAPLYLPSYIMLHDPYMETQSKFRILAPLPTEHYKSVGVFTNRKSTTERFNLKTTWFIEKSKAWSEELMAAVSAEIKSAFTSKFASVSSIWKRSRTWFRRAQEFNFEVRVPPNSILAASRRSLMHMAKHAL